MGDWRIEGGSANGWCCPSRSNLYDTGYTTFAPYMQYLEAVIVEKDAEIVELQKQRGEWVQRTRRNDEETMAYVTAKTDEERTAIVERMER